MHVAVDAVGIRDGGGAAILCELIEWLPRVRPAWKWHIFVLPSNARQFEIHQVDSQVVIESIPSAISGLGRYRWVQTQVHERARSLGVDVLFAFANLASGCPQLPQVLFLQNANILHAGPEQLLTVWQRLRFALMRRMLLRTLSATSVIVVQSQSMRNALTDLAPISGTKIRVIPSGYRIPSAQPVIRPTIKGLIETASGPKLTYISLLRLHKNHETLVRALPKILESFPKASLLLTVGNEAEQGGVESNLLRKIKATAAELNITDRIVWLGQITHEEVHFLLGASDLMVFPSVSESFGLPLVEAFAATCPVVAAKLPYAIDVAGDAAEYFDPRNELDLAMAVKKVLCTPEVSDRLRRLGTSRLETFRYEVIAAKLAEILESAANVISSNQ